MVQYILRQTLGPTPLVTFSFWVIWFPVMDHCESISISFLNNVLMPLMVLVRCNRFSVWKGKNEVGVLDEGIMPLIAVYRGLENALHKLQKWTLIIDSTENNIFFFSNHWQPVFPLDIDLYSVQLLFYLDQLKEQSQTWDLRLEVRMGLEASLPQYSIIPCFDRFLAKLSFFLFNIWIDNLTGFINFSWSKFVSNVEQSQTW